MDSQLGGFNTTVRDHVNYYFWPQGVQINGEAADPSQVGAQWDLSSVPWLSYDSSTRYLSGVTPDTYLNGTSEPIQIPVNLTYPDTDSIPTSLYVEIQPYRFTALNLPQVNYTSGPLNYSFADYMRDPYSGVVWVEVFFTPTEADQWLNLTEDRTGLFGTPPNASYDNVNVELLAWDMSTNLTSTSTVLIQLRQPTTTTNGTNPTASTAPSEATGATGLSKTAMIALIATLCGVFFLVLLCLLLFCCCRRRRRRQQDLSVREKGIGKPVRAPSALPPPIQPGLSSATSSPTLVVNSPHADGEMKDKEKAFYGSTKTEDTFDHSRSETPVEQLRTMYPDAFLPSEESPADDSFLASESHDTHMRGPGVRLTPTDLRNQFGVTASEADQIRMIDEAVRNSISDRHMSSEFGEHMDEARRSHFMNFFDAKPEAIFKGRAAVTPHDSIANESVSNGIVITPRGLSSQDADPFQGRQYDAFGRLIKRPTEPDLWNEASEPRALGQKYFADDSNPFGEGQSASTLGLNQDRAHSDSEPGLGEFSEDDESGSGGETMEDYSNSDEHYTEVRHAKVVDVSDERYRSTGTPRVVYAGEDFNSTYNSGLPDPETLSNLDYPVSTLFSPSMSVRLINSTGAALSPDSVSTARLGQNAIFPPSTPKGMRSEARLAYDSPQVPRRPARSRFDSTDSTGSRLGNPLQPYKFLARAAEPFHFYPVLHPPPPVIPTSSRSSTIVRPTYVLQPDSDSDLATEKLPSWLHWDAGELKLWGHPSRQDAHQSYAARVIERTVVPPGSPTKGRSPAGSVEEKTVSRLVIEVAARTR